MITVKSQLSQKEQEHIRISLQELSDLYNDFYITKNNLRLTIRDNTDLLFDNLKGGDKIAFGEGGFAYISGFSDNAPRKYVKILPKTEEGAERLIKVILQNIHCDLFIKIKKNNPIKEILKRNQFFFVGDRGREILLKRKYIERKKYIKQ